jgi:hypothetical protein
MVRDMRGMRGKVPWFCRDSPRSPRRPTEIVRDMRGMRGKVLFGPSCRSGKMRPHDSPQETVQVNDPTGGFDAQEPVIRKMWMQVSLTKGNPPIFRNLLPVVFARVEVKQAAEKVGWSRKACPRG